MHTPITIRKISCGRLSRLGHLDFRIRHRAIHKQGITRHRFNLRRVSRKRIANLHLETTRRERIDHKMSRAIGNHEAVKSRDANDRHRVTKHDIAFDRRKGPKFKRIDPRIRSLGIESYTANRTRRDRSIDMASFHRVGARLHRNFHITVDIRLRPFCGIRRFRQIIFRKNTNATVRGDIAVRQLQLQSDSRFSLGTASDIPLIVGTCRKQGDGKYSHAKQCGFRQSRSPRSF